MAMTAGDWDSEWWAKQEAKRRAEEMQETLVKKQLAEIRTAHVAEEEDGVDYECIGELVGGAINPLVKRIEALEKDMAERLRWRGTWKAGESYQGNDMTQDKNTIHVCTAAETSARPGTGAGWRQLVTLPKAVV
jgi:hypothetical protein